MVGGENNDLAPIYENEVGGDGGANHELVESETKSPITNSRTNPNVVPYIVEIVLKVISAWSRIISVIKFWFPFANRKQAQFQFSKR